VLQSLFEGIFLTALVLMLFLQRLAQTPRS